ncbi:MAG: hypothetical protein GX790_04835, partial [Syntrophomonadaceae bacterium]|nr:hypothetical protein [Syntrophomonadaceae bacterium]
MGKNQLLIENMINSHRRIFMGTIIIMVLAVLATIGIYVTGTGSETLSLGRLARPVIFSAVFTMVSFILVKKFREREISKYIAVTMVAVNMFFFAITMTGSPELFATFYFVMVLSLIYVDVFITIYTAVLIMLLHTIIIVVHPEVIPSGNLGAVLGVRYVCFILFALAGVIITRVFRGLLLQSIENEEKAKEL